MPRSPIASPLPTFWCSSFASSINEQSLVVCGEQRVASEATCVIVAASAVNVIVRKRHANWLPVDSVVERDHLGGAWRPIRATAPAIRGFATTSAADLSTAERPRRRVPRR
jgi:hypothetical protein